MLSVVDVEQGQILCLACGDYVYDSEIGRIAHACKEKSRRSLGLDTEYRTWEPDPVEMTLLQAHPKRRRPTPNSTIGLSWMIFLLIFACHSLVLSVPTDQCVCQIALPCLAVSEVA